MLGDVIGDVDAAVRFAQNPHVDILDILARAIDDGGQRRHVIWIDKHRAKLALHLHVMR